MFKSGAFTEGQSNDFCGTTVTKKGAKHQRKDCCSGIKEKGVPLNDCDSQGTPQGPAFKSIMAFAADEEEWLKNFHLAWKFATENGHPNLTFIDQEARFESVLPVDAEAFECESLSKKWECKKSYQCAWEDIEEPEVVNDEELDDEVLDEEEVEEAQTGKKMKGKKMKKAAGNCVPL